MASFNSLDLVMPEGSKTKVQFSPSTPQVIRELRNYEPFTCGRSLGHSLLVARDTYKHENRAIGVFTSGDDAPGINAEQSTTTISALFFLIFSRLKNWFIYSLD